MAERRGMIGVNGNPSLLEFVRQMKEADGHVEQDEDGCGDCIVAAFFLMSAMIAEKMITPKDEDVTLVHAIIHGTGPQEGKLIFHAWIEWRGFAWDAANNHLFVFLARDYREHAEVVVTREYTPKQVWKLFTTHETYGPWDPIFNDKSLFRDSEQEQERATG